MKHIVKSLVIVGTMAAAGSAGADMMFGDFNPYVGIDYYHAWMKGKDSPDLRLSAVSPKSFPGASIYVGSKFTENFGLELGFDSSTRKKKAWTQNAVTGTTKIRRTGWHVDLVGFLPINECTNLLGSIGYGWLKPKMDVTSNNQQYSFKAKDKSIVRVGVGADWMATDMLGLRGKINWETTSMLRVKESDSRVNQKYKAFKDSITLAGGVFVKF